MTGFHPDFGTVVSARAVQLPPDPDAQVRITIKEILKNVREDTGPNETFLAEHARSVGLKGNDRLADILKTWNHIKQSMRFQEDETTAARFQPADAAEARKMGFPEDTIEVIIRPIDQALLIRWRGMGFEDCDGFEGYASALLRTVGIPSSFVTIAADPDRPHWFSHVYLAAYPNGYGRQPRIPLDFSHGPFPGWEAPHLGRIREWPVEITAGEILCDALMPIGLLVGMWFGLKYLERA